MLLCFPERDRERYMRHIRQQKEEKYLLRQEFQLH